MKPELALIKSMTTLATASLGSITIATLPVAVTTTVPAAGILGWVGITTTATTIVAAPVTLPVAGIVAVGALLTYGGCKAYELLTEQQD